MNSCMVSGYSIATSIGYRELLGVATDYASKIYQKLPSTETLDTINCKALIQNASANIKLAYIVSECAQLSLIQKARIKNDPEICNQILLQKPSSSEFDNVALKQAACLVHFHGSIQWKRGCDMYKNNEYYGMNYDSLASCSSPTVEQPKPYTETIYWFN